MKHTQAQGDIEKQWREREEGGGERGRGEGGRGEGVREGGRG